VSCEQNCAGIRREIGIQNMLHHDTTKVAGFVSFNPETSEAIPGVLLVMNSVLLPERKRMAKTAI
jgi:hypothetical protein